MVTTTGSPAGQLTYTYDGEFLVTLDTQLRGWSLSSVTLYVSTELPLDATNASITSYTFKQRTYEFETSIPLEISCGSRVYIAFTAQASRIQNGQLQETNIVSFGDSDFAGSEFLTYSRYDTCCDVIPCPECFRDENCVDDGDKCTVARCTGRECKQIDICSEPDPVKPQPTKPTRPVKPNNLSGYRSPKTAIDSSSRFQNFRSSTTSTSSHSVNVVAVVVATVASVGGAALICIALVLVLILVFAIVTNHHRRQKKNKKQNPRKEKEILPSQSYDLIMTTESSEEGFTNPAFDFGSCEDTTPRERSSSISSSSIVQKPTPRQL
eukprot:CAMPEP_0206191324 /NCGR_PEP_ID=MMETSP0166-20121206/5299_1 /ASSEMBLY_ACC=CAM_ASM_000260 /TAXON_ID=95228 /ORGANISM="Vannella robusta, Strain DIVA3 518/3/11/1/6" /LENGTH=323 /DNA_ID=CAMNT_0053607615 /DNA_START=272 /DNA_END=1243 /DNA_ORIENTATION=+